MLKKQLFITVLFIVPFLLSNAQHGISLDYDENSRGQNFNLAYRYVFDYKNSSKHQDDVGVGFSFLLNQDWANKPNVHIFYRNFHAFNFGQRFGFFAEYKHHFVFNKLNNFSLYPYAHLHYLYGQSRSNNLDIKFDPQHPSQLLGYDLKEVVSNKTHVISAFFGLGANIKIKYGFSINLKAGAGLNYYKQTDKKLPQSNTQWIGGVGKDPYAGIYLGYQYTVGLQYQFQKRKKKDK